MREQRDKAILKSQFGILQNSHVNQQAAQPTDHEPSTQADATLNDSSTASPDAENHSPAAGSSNSEVHTNQEQSYRESNTTALDGYVGTTDMGLKISKKGNHKDYVGTKHKCNGVIELEYISNPNPTTHNHGHWVVKINEKIIDTIGDNNRGL